MLPATEARIGVKALRALMVARDYQEIVSYSFVDRQWEIDFCANRDPVTLVNPIAAHLNVMRSGLLGSLVDSLKLNLSRQQERVRLFEIGRCFGRAGTGYSQVTMLGGLAYGGAVAEQWDSARRPVDFYDVKSDLESLVWAQTVRFEATQHPALHPGRAARLVLEGVPAGWVGELHPRLQQKYDLPFAPMVFELNLELIRGRKPVHYQEFSRLPAVRRDLAVEVAETVSAQAMLDALKRRASSIVSEVALFDVYRGKGIDSDKKSVAFRVLLQDTHKTLTDAEAETAIQQFLQVLQEDFKATLRK
jgi:phenylalanyl-tRNA synthetase beta chain